LAAKGVKTATEAAVTKAPELYREALKPPPSSKLNVAATQQQAIQTGLREGIPVSKGGMEKLSNLIDDLNEKVSAAIAEHPEREINPAKVAQRTRPTAERFGEQVNPESDVAAVESSKQEFLRKHTQEQPYTPIHFGPVDEGEIGAIPGQPTTEKVLRDIPAVEAQAEKTGTYAQLKGKYGELKGAQIEAQKALARGIKEELATQFPEISALNKREGDALDLMPYLVRAVERIGNRGTFGIGTPLTAAGTKAITGSNKMAAAAAIMRAVWETPGIKSRIAIGLHNAGMNPANVDARIAAFGNALVAAAGNNEKSERQTGGQSTEQVQTQPNQ
jgi:hypothetical protein